MRSRILPLLGLVVLALPTVGCSTVPPVASGTPSVGTPAPSVGTPAPSVALATPRPLLDDLPTPPGSYVLAADAEYGVAPIDITFTVPAEGWVSWGPGVLTNEPDVRDRVGIGFANIADLYVDPCSWDQKGLQPDLGPTVADLAAGFGRQPWFTASEPEAATVGGFDGLLVTMTLDADLDFSTCHRSEVHSWLEAHGWSRYYQGPGQVEQFWILDVDGTRVVIEGSFFPDAPPANLTDLQALVDSIKITP